MGTDCMKPLPTANPEACSTHRSIYIEKEVPSFHHGISKLACGYGFNIESRELKEVMATHNEALAK